jgi:hypothetical protein
MRRGNYEVKFGLAKYEARQYEASFCTAQGFQRSMRRLYLGSWRKRRQSADLYRGPGLRPSWARNGDGSRRIGSDVTSTHHRFRPT